MQSSKRHWPSCKVAISNMLIVCTSHLLLVDVVNRLAVAVVVEINLNESLWVLAKLNKHAQEDALLLESGCLHLEYGDEDLVQEHFDLFL
jgi:hypothetical protein